MSYARSARGSSGGLADCWDLRISRLFLFLKVSVPGFELRVDYEDMARLCCFGAGCSDVSPTFDRFPRLFFWATDILASLEFLSITFVFQSLIQQDTDFFLFISQINLRFLLRFSFFFILSSYS
jgi:hypothetical protein